MIGQRLLVLLCVSFLGMGTVANGVARADGGDIVTVIGSVTPNRGVYDPFRDGYLKFRDKHFDKAFAFTREALAKLPQATITARAEGWPARVTLTGPRLADVLRAAGVPAEAKIVATALDGYNVDLLPSDRAAHDWVVAIDADGKPLGVGGRGPAWLLYDTKDATVGPDVEANWVWALFVLEAM